MNVVPPCGCRAPGAADPATCYCSVEDLLGILRRRYSLVVLRAIDAHREAHYQHVAAAVPSASTSTLAETLRALEAARLVTKGAGARPSYRLTTSGAKLLRRLRGLLQDVQAS